ncbi:hypothetical protein DIPPA_31239 [Diplonema papillatum]|nr:hypothetical protein DIPPA_31239 [Diplonema papillatum]
MCTPTPQSEVRRRGWKAVRDRTDELQTAWTSLGGGQGKKAPAARAESAEQAAVHELAAVVASVEDKVSDYATKAVRGDGADARTTAAELLQALAHELADLLKHCETQLQDFRETISDRKARQPLTHRGSHTHDYYETQCTVLLDRLSAAGKQFAAAIQFNLAVKKRRQRHERYDRTQAREAEPAANSSPRGNPKQPGKGARPDAVRPASGAERMFTSLASALPSALDPVRALRAALPSGVGPSEAPREAAGGGGGAGDGEPAEEGSPDGRPGMSNEMLLLALQDDTHVFTELERELAVVANISQSIQSHLASHDASLQQIEDNAYSASSHITQAGKHLQEAEKVKWTPRKMVAVLIFFFANVLLLAHWVRP